MIFDRKAAKYEEGYRRLVFGELRGFEGYSGHPVEVEADYR
jgi:hypothetical protein